MKRIWYAAAIAVILTAICVYENLLINNTVENIESGVDAVVSALENGDAETAMEKSEKIKNDWSKSSILINYLISHEITDIIEDKISTFNLIVPDGDSTLLRIKAEELKLKIQILREGEKLQGENFF